MKISIRVVMLLAILLMVAVTSDVSTAFQRRNNRADKVRELIHAAHSGDTSKVIQLLNSGVNVNATFPRGNSGLSGKTALMAASLRGHSGLVRVLIKRGADVNQKENSGQTALLFAAYEGDQSTIKTLLDAGADPNVMVASFHAGEITPLSTALNSRHPQRFEIVRLLLAAKAELNPKIQFGASPLMHALEDLEMVQLLVAHGADVNLKNFRGVTPLMIAAGGRDVAVVKYLIEKGADVKARDQEGHTPLKYAEVQREMMNFDDEERDEIIQVLKKAEAEIKP